MNHLKMSLIPKRLKPNKAKAVKSEIKIQLPKMRFALLLKEPLRITLVMLSES